MNKFIKLSILLGFLAMEAKAFEDTRVLPKGVRRLNFTALSTQISKRSDASGGEVSIIDRLNKDINFSLLVSTQRGLKKTSIPAFLANVGGENSSLAGSFLADAGLDLAGYGVQFNYGITDNVTLGIGVPIYKASVRLSTGFRMSDTSQRLTRLLTRPEYNQVEAARQVLSKLNNPRPVLNGLLRSNSYQDLQDWEGSGIGDMIVGLKWRSYRAATWGVALTTGVVLPTGKRDDPAILNDFRIGDGQFDLFQTVTVDKNLARNWRVAAHAKYTYQAPAQKQLRHESATALFSPTSSTAHFKLGDKYELGASTRLATDVGLDLQTGVVFSGKTADNYHDLPADVQRNYEKNTKARAYIWENALGYSSVEAYKRKELAVPFSVQLGFKKHLSSVNSPISDQVSVDFAVFF